MICTHFSNGQETEKMIENCNFHPTLFTYIAKRDDLVAMADELFEVVLSGKVKVKIEIHQEYALKDAAQAHIDLEARKTTGSTVLIP